MVDFPYLFVKKQNFLERLRVRLDYAMVMLGLAMLSKIHCKFIFSSPSVSMLHMSP